MTQTSNRIILTYLNTGGRAEAIRLCFTVGGVPFEDRRITPEQFAANQQDHSRFPTEQLPVLDVGPRKYTQAMAILRFAGKLAGLYPFDPKEALAIDEALDHIFEIYKTEPAFNKTVTSAQAANLLHRSGSMHNSAENSPLLMNDPQSTSNNNNNNSNHVAPTSNNIEQLLQVRSRKNSPIPPVGTPPSGSNDDVSSKHVNLGDLSNANNSSSAASNSALISPPSSPQGGLRKTNSISYQHQGLFSGSFDAEACLSQIKLCFRRVCELINSNEYCSPYIGSPRPTIADFAVFALVRQIQRGMIPHVPSTLLEANEFAPLYQLVDILEDYPGVKFFYNEQ